MTDNMKLWNQVSKTDPAHTKKVNQRGGFTAIDAHYQVQQATKEFGPVGKMWGYECVHGITDNMEIAWCDVTLWWSEGDGSNQFGPIRGMAKLKTGERIDQDASKKAMTDAITKGLSHLGFSADVFLGKFDDNKYVNEMKAEFGKETADLEWATDVILRLNGIKDVSKFNEALEKLRPAMEGRHSKAVDEINSAIETIKVELGEKK